MNFQLTPLDATININLSYLILGGLSDASVGATVYPKKYAHGFVVLCFVVVMQSFIMNSHEVFIHFHQGCFAGTGAIVRLPQCQWSKPDGYGKISQCITTTKHSKAKTVRIFLGIYCIFIFVVISYLTILMMSYEIPYSAPIFNVAWNLKLNIIFHHENYHPIHALCIGSISAFIHLPGMLGCYVHRYYFWTTDL